MTYCVRTEIWEILQTRDPFANIALLTLWIFVFGQIIGQSNIKPFWTQSWRVNRGPTSGEYCRLRRHRWKRSGTYFLSTSFRGSEVYDRLFFYCETVYVILTGIDIRTTRARRRLAYKAVRNNCSRFPARSTGDSVCTGVVRVGIIEWRWRVWSEIREHLPIMPSDHTFNPANGFARTAAATVGL